MPAVHPDPRQLLPSLSKTRVALSGGSTKPRVSGSQGCNSPPPKHLQNEEAGKHTHLHRCPHTSSALLHHPSASSGACVFHLYITSHARLSPSGNARLFFALRRCHLLYVWPVWLLCCCGLKGSLLFFVEWFPCALIAGGHEASACAETYKPTMGRSCSKPRVGCEERPHESGESGHSLHH